ncbi:MAG: hypothetical protein WBX01_01590 [Nitrososphaeraceae archaeon]
MKLLVIVPFGSLVAVPQLNEDMGIRCKRPKLELLHGPDYEEGKEKVENYKDVALALKKGVMLAFEDETTITQKPCIRKSMKKIEHIITRR